MRFLRVYAQLSPGLVRLLPGLQIFHQAFDLLVVFTKIEMSRFPWRWIVNPASLDCFPDGSAPRHDLDNVVAGHDDKMALAKVYTMP